MKIRVPNYLEELLEARMLNTLLNENLFIPSAPSMIALRELQATLLTHALCCIW